MVSKIRSEVMAQPAADRLEYAISALEFYLDPAPAFFQACRDARLDLTATELRTLHALYQRRGRLVTVEALRAAECFDRPPADWPDKSATYMRLVNVRRALAARGLPVSITVFRGVGYQLDAAPDFTLGVAI